MSSEPVFNTSKNSYISGLLNRDAFKRHFAHLGGECVKASLSDPGDLLENWILPKDSSTVLGDIDKLTKAAEESQMYEPVLNILNKLSTDVANMFFRTSAAQDRFVISFYRGKESPLLVMEEEGKQKPDLVAFRTKPQGTDNIGGNHPSAGFDALDKRTGYELVCTVEVKKDRNGGGQPLRYLFSNSRHRPESYIRHGLFINRKEFRLVTLTLDRRVIWEPVQWKSEDALIKLYSCVILIYMEEARVVPTFVPKLMEIIVPSGSKPKRNITAIYSVPKIGKSTFDLLPIFVGRGNGRKTFVALVVSRPRNVSDNDPATGWHGVFKYSWFKTPFSDTEMELLLKLRNVPGVVQINEGLSIGKVEKNLPVNFLGDSVEKEYVERTRTLIALDTIGYPLCSCGSVLEFLEAMYDLLEVLRYVAQEYNILHRDISWSNVLIRPFSPTGSFNPAKNKPSQTHYHHKYRFISDIFGEEGNEWKIRAVLTDFDHGAKRDKVQNMKDATGTPMFMALDLLKLRGKRQMSRFGPKVHLGFLLDNEQSMASLFSSDCGKKYETASEKDDWNKFYKEEVANLRWCRDPSQVSDENIKELFEQGVVHDAESVFYLCILFFNRMWPRGEFTKESDMGELAVMRGEMFQYLADKRNISQVSMFVDLPENGFCQGARFTPLYNMLTEMMMYLSVPWYNVAGTGKGDSREYHLHDFMQRLLLREIVRLRGSKDPIPIHKTPLPVRLSSETSRTFTETSTGIIAESQRRKGDASGSKEDLVSPETRPGELLTNKGSGSFKDNGAVDCWSIYWWKRRERLWLMSDKLYETPQLKADADLELDSDNEF